MSSKHTHDALGPSSPSPPSQRQRTASVGSTPTPKIPFLHKLAAIRDSPSSSRDPTPASTRASTPSSSPRRAIRGSQVSRRHSIHPIPTSKPDPDMPAVSIAPMLPPATPSAPPPPSEPPPPPPPADTDQILAEATRFMETLNHQSRLTNGAVTVNAKSTGSLSLDSHDTLADMFLEFQKGTDVASITARLESIQRRLDTVSKETEKVLKLAQDIQAQCNAIKTNEADVDALRKTFMEVRRWRASKASETAPHAVGRYVSALRSDNEGGPPTRSPQGRPENSRVVKEEEGKEKRHIAKQLRAAEELTLQRMALSKVYNEFLRGRDRLVSSGMGTTKAQLTEEVRRLTWVRDNFDNSVRKIEMLLSIKHK